MKELVQAADRRFMRQMKRCTMRLPVFRDPGMWGIHDSTSIDQEGEDGDLDERLAGWKQFVDWTGETERAAHILVHPSLPAPQMRGLVFPVLTYCAQQRERSAMDGMTVDGLVTATIAAKNEGGRA